MDTIHFKKLAPDYWGRERIQNTESKRIYAKVDGRFYSTSKDGEPDCPLRKDIKFIEVV